jgi:dTDP-4-amino-4,6-dideoxygalactose transaminase
MVAGAGAGAVATDVIRFSEPDISEEEVEAAAAVLRSGWITTGEECAQLEAELAEYVGIEHVVAVSSCTAALEIAVAHLGLPRGARIGVPTWTFVSTAMAAYHRGLEPVLLDVDPGTLNLSESSLAAALDSEPGLDAVVAVHFAGVAVPRPIHDLCAAAGVPLIEDAAHAMGTRDHRGLIGGRSTAGCCFSFYATKNLTSAEGGALATDDPELADFARSFRLHGLSKDAWNRYRPDAKTLSYDVLGDGLKANLPDVLAAVARVQLRRFDELQARRRMIVDAYRSALADVPGVRLVPGEAEPDSADHLMVVVLPDGTDRSAVQASMQAQGIGTSVHFRPLHTFGWFAEQGVGPGPGGTPVADELAERTLSLPLHPRLSEGDVARVVDSLRSELTPPS